MRLRLILSFALVVLVSIVTVLLVARQGAVTEVRQFMRGPMMGLDILVETLEDYYQQSGTWEGAGVLLEEYRSRRGMGQGMMGALRLRLADSSGVVVADNQREPEGLLNRMERQAAYALRGSRGQVVGYLLADGIAANPNTEQMLLERLLRAGLIGAAVSGGLALLIALLLAYGLLKPVNDLTQAAAQMARGDLSQRVAVPRADEMGTLARAFNHMAASLQRAEQNRRMITADIAHELRTPIAVQRAHLEALQDGVYPLTIENLQPVLDQTELLTRLVEDLRTLALADAGELRLEREPADLLAILRRVTDRFRPEAEARQVQMAVEEQGNAQTQMLLDAGRVEQILNNLVSNALRHTPAGGQIMIVLQHQSGGAVIQVMDSGPGIPAESLSRIFERFYRTDSARSRAQGGTGLGLAIARQLALAHGGDLTAGNRPEGGAAFTLRLPSAGQETA
jgi:signal transduction histidine kinase